MRARRYLIWMLATALLLILSAGAFNLVIDPYGVFNLVAIEGVNAKKAYAYTHKRLAKERRALRLQPNTVLLGNSRIDVGFNPQSPAWPAEMQPVANIGIPGEGMDGIVRAYSLAVRKMQPNAIVVGLDFFDFLSASPPAPGERLSRQDSYDGELLPHLPETVFSTTATIDSLLTIKAQRERDSTAMTAAGFNPMQNYKAIVRREGQWPMVLEKDKLHVRYLETRPAAFLQPNGVPAAPLVYLRDILEDAARRDLRVEVVLYPFHAHFLETLHLSGRWALFEAWKREVLSVWLSVKNSAPGWPSTLWDFSVYDPLTTEAAPLPDHKDRRMDWYWEAGHFKAELGDKMIAQMTGTAPNGFGVRLTAASLDAHLRRQQVARNHYESANPEAVSYLRDLCRPLGCAERTAQP